MDKPRILIIENCKDVTGALKSITRTAYDLQSSFSFSFIIPAGSKGRAWIESKGFTDIVELPMKEISKSLVRLLIYLPYLIYNSIRVRNVLKSKRIDLIHNNDLYNLIPVVLRMTGNKTPYVCHIRLLPEKFPKILFAFWLRLHLKYSTTILTVSRFLQEQLPASPKILMVHNELPVEERYTDQVAKHGTPTMLYLSNIIPGKGHQYALEAFARVCTNINPWTLRFVGGDMGFKKNKEYRQQLIALADNLKIGQRVQWLDFAEDVEREYKQAEICLNFSESESFSITCLEALYFGRPIIATDCGGPAEIIDHMETGILVQNRNVDRMVEAMDRLMSDEALRKSLGENARKRVRVRFSIENTSLRLKEIYDSILI